MRQLLDLRSRQLLEQMQDAILLDSLLVGLYRTFL